MNHPANNPSRRDFLRLTAIAAAAGVVIRPVSWAAGIHQPLGVQLYMVRRQAAVDLAGILKQIHAVGFEQVETYWSVYSHSAADLKAMITDAGLSVPSGHFDYDGLEGKLTYARALGLKYVVCPMLPKEQWTSADGFAKASKDFNHWGKQIADLGMKFAFHNHDYEFRPQGTTTGFQILMEQTDPNLVGLEMDCYWMTQAGQDPLQMLHAHADRIHLLHIKDRTPAPTSFNMDKESEHFIEAGKGAIDYKAIIGQAQSQGIHYYFMDQDETKGPPIESLRESYKYLRTFIS
jgi:sugar phosphate isomerase/epimerase